MLPVRTTASTVSQHIADHTEIHEFVNSHPAEHTAVDEFVTMHPTDEDAHAGIYAPAGLPQIATFGSGGTVTASAGVGRFRFPFAATVSGVTAAINTAPTGSSLIMDVNKNGTTIFTTQANRPTITSGSNATVTEAIPNVTAMAVGDYLTVDVDQVGSVIAGANLTIFVEFSNVLDQNLATFGSGGTLVVSTGVSRFRFPFTATLLGVSLAVDTPPTGSEIIVDVNKNGSTVFTTQGNRPTIAIGSNASTVEATPDVTAADVGDYLTIDIDQVGSSVAGANLSVFIRYTVN